jgi:hypothetical protein
MMKRDPKMKVCYDRVIPEEYNAKYLAAHKKHTEALLKKTGAKTPREAFKGLNPKAIIPAVHMAVINSKGWGAGFILKCRFLDGSEVQKNKVMAKAKLWEQYANIHISFVTTNDEHVRISFIADSGSWSAVGKDALITEYFPKNEATMNFGWLKNNTPDAEYERVVVHEFGHALGCIHEHQSPKENLKWNIEAVYAQFSGPPNNWDKATIDANILQKYSSNGISATIFDRNSIMLYQFDAKLFLDHKPTPANIHLSAKDKAFIATMYPF